MRKLITFCLMMVVFVAVNNTGLAVSQSNTPDPDLYVRRKPKSIVSTKKIGTHAVMITCENDADPAGYKPHDAGVNVLIVTCGK